MPEETYKADSTHAVEPPSSILHQFFVDTQGKEPSSRQLETVAGKCLLPVEEVSLWLDHLRTIDQNRKRGASKAAKTRRSKTNKHTPRHTGEGDCYCGVCEGLYGVEEGEYWVGCDGCFQWFHHNCVALTPENEPEHFFCPECVQSS